MLNEQLPSRPKRLLSYTIIFLTAVYPLHPAWGAAMTATDKNTQISQQNNVPIINIATPNGAGISHNKFQDFNVDKQGAVLNNATANVNSQIAGQIKANANLKGKSANLIINEVTGSSRSELQGKLEVAGKGANVLIANPNGITCNGCSFVNTPAITLTTGKPILDNKGALSAVEVKKGSVVIGANGMNAEAQTYADIISRATELNGQIKAKNLTLMQGTNRVDFQKGTVTPIAGEGAKPSISVDTKALGGMYANQVKLVSTESGVGINLSNVQTNQNDLTLTVDGKITLAGNIQGKKDINISTKNLQINANANVNAAKDITLATNTLTNNGKVIAGKDMRVFAESVSNTGNNALIQAQDNLWIQKNAKGDLSTLIENKSGTIKTNAGDLVIRTKQLENKREQFLLSKGKVTLPTERYMLNLNGVKSEGAWIQFGLNAYIGADENRGVINYNYFNKLLMSELINNKNNPVDLHTKKTEFFIEKSSSEANISSGKNAYINANLFNNIHSKVQAKDNLILTGNILKNPIQSVGVLNTFERYTPTGQKFRGGFCNGCPINKRETITVWDESKTYTGQFLAGKNIVLDFSSSISFEKDEIVKNASSYTFTQPSTIIQANNILLNSKKIELSGGIKSNNDINFISDNLINLKNFSSLAKNNISLISNNQISNVNASFNASNISFIAKNGNIQHGLNTLWVLKDSILSLSAINASNSLHVQAGKNVTFDNAQLAKTNKLTLSANDNIVIRRDESNLMKLAALEPVADINTLLVKTGNWTSSGEINLTAGKNIEARGITFNSGKSIAFNAGQDILLGAKAIKDADNIFKTNRYPELRSQLIANGNITLNAARDMDLQSSNIQAKDKITALSGRDIKLTATAYSGIPNPNEDNQDVRYVTSTLSGDKGVTLASNGALTAQGSTIKSLGDITISSGGNVRLEAVKTHYRKQEGKRLEDLYRQIGTEINSGKTLTILSEGSILFQASRLVAKGTMDIAAKGGYLYAQAMEETSHYEESGKKCNKWTACITKKEVKKTRSETTNKVTEFTAGGDINLYAKDDVTLEATKINAGKNAKITSQTGKVNFKAVKNTTFEQVISNSKGFYISQRNKGYKEDTWILPALHIGGKLTIDAAKGITADIKAKNAQSLQNALNSLGQTEGTKWLAGLKDRKDVQWGLVQDAYDSWDYKSQSLNPVASALIMITVAAITSGTAQNFAAWVASGTEGTAHAIISGAAYSGMTALSTQAAVALAENQGNLSKTLNSLGKSDTVKSIITQMVISGALNGLDEHMKWTTGNPGDAKLPLLANNDWNKVAQRVAAQSAISSTINTAAFGGNFTDNFKNALLSNIGNQINAEGAFLIGNNRTFLGDEGAILSHMALTAASAEVSRGNAKGAVAGVLAAEFASLMGVSFSKEKDWKEALDRDVQLNKVFGGFAGAIFTGEAGGVYSGANSAEIVTKYNQQHYIRWMMNGGDNLIALESLSMKSGLEGEELVDAMARALKGFHSESMDPAKQFILAWGNMVGIPLDIIMENKPLDAKTAAEIASSGIPTSEAKLVQYFAAKIFLSYLKGNAIEIKTGQAVDFVRAKELGRDIASNKDKFSESSAALELENIFGGKIVRSKTPEVDFRFEGGKLDGKSIDFMFTTDNGTKKEIEMLNTYFVKNKNIEKISGHLDKADYVPLDLRLLTPENEALVVNYVNSLSKKDQSRIILMR
ncbi:DUF637 domain-containing protein [Providencia sp.]|uniref:two-partner secretion domain-containing protein n=1 Tax=Providencia sp. TaxID=589 RepID=UPI00333E7E86